jgi:methyl-accepting chemotaxis protein
VRLNVRTKLLGAFLVVVATMVVIGVVAMTRLDDVDKTTTYLGTERLETIGIVHGLDGMIKDFRQDQLTLLLAPDPTAREELSRRVSEGAGAITGILSEGRNAGSDEEDKANAGRLDDAFRSYLVQTGDLIRGVQAGRAEEVTEALVGPAALSAWAAVTEATQPVLQHQQRLGAAAATQSADQVSQTKTIVIVMLAISALIAIGLALWLARGIAGGLRQLRTAAHGIAQGDVRQRIEVRSRDDVGATAKEFEEMVAYLEEMSRAAQSIAAGDLTVEVRPRSEQDALGHAFQELAARLHEALGDRSSLDLLVERMEQLSSNDLAALEQALAAVAAGDLTARATTSTQRIASDDDGAELGRLAEIFNAMLEQLHASVTGYDEMRERVAAMLRQISTQTQAVASASQQMATTSDETGRAVGEIASAVGEVAAGAERQVRTVGEARRLSDEVVAATNNSSEHADATAQAAERARSVAEQGAATAEQATAAMDAVRASSGEVTDAIQSLGERSQRIGGIVAAITGIAEQTNLLALNAAIEAARAGEQGRGFAVVAEEVRKLAEESQQAAASISSLIDEIQRETERAVQVVETSASQTERTSTTVEQARDAFREISASVEDMAQRVEQIAAAASEVSASAAGMERNMAEVASVAEQSSASTEQVSASTQQTSASSQEIAASAQQLAGTARELERLVGQFSL